MDISLQSTFIVRNVFRRNLCIFFSTETHILLEAIEKKIELLLETKSSILVVSSFPLPEKFNNNASIVWFKFCDFFESNKKRISCHDAIIICESVEKNLNDVVRLALRRNKDVFVALQQDPNNILEIFKKKGKQFVFFSSYDDGSFHIKRFRKPLPYRISTKVKLALIKDPSYWHEEKLLFFDATGSGRAGKNSLKFPDFYKNSTHKTSDSIDLEEDIFEKENFSFDESVNEEELEFVPSDDEDSNEGLF